MAILTKEKAQAILKKALSFSKADECMVRLRGTEGGNVRYARNAVSTTGDISKMTLEIGTSFGKRSGNSSINEFDDISLEKAVRRAEEVAKLSPENPEHMPLPGPQNYLNSVTYKSATADMNADTRATHAAQSLEAARENGLNAAGFLENETGFHSIMNSKGLFAYNVDTELSFSVTLRNSEGTGSGYAGKTYADVTKLDTVELTKIAASKAKSSVGAKVMEPGKYTVILEPMAACDIIQNIFSIWYNGLDARTADEGRSFMSRKGGGNRLGEQVYNEKVTIYSDPLHDELPYPPFGDDGLPNKKTVWVDKGIAKQLVYSRYWAQQKGMEVQPPITQMVMEGGNTSLDDMIKNTEKGILITRFYYIRMVDPQTFLLTGLTRDGTFYIENGKIMHPVKNFRFNESPVIMLNNVEELGKPERTTTMIVPPLKIRDFTFTSLSDAV